MFAQSLLAVLFVMAAPPAQPRVAILLVPAIGYRSGERDGVWGKLRYDEAGNPKWDGTIGTAIEYGYRFGGTIQVNGGDVDVSEDLDVAGVASDSRTANLFVLRYSHAVGYGSVLARGLEISSAILAIREWTGTTKVTLLTYSAGGIAARVYLQSLLAEYPYRGDVDRLVTIGAPHLGSALADLASVLGVPLEEITPRSRLIRVLNDERDLPADVRYLSIIIRSFGSDIRGSGGSYSNLVAWSAAKVSDLPTDLRLGGDEVLHVQTQNLALSRSAVRYESLTKRPVWYWPIRVAGELRGGRIGGSAFDTAHTSALCTREVQRMALQFVDPEVDLWKPADEATRAKLASYWASLCAFSAVEGCSSGRHPIAGVNRCEIWEVDRLASLPDGVHYRFSGTAYYRGDLLPCPGRWPEVSGRFGIALDEFGRVQRFWVAHDRQ